MDPLDAELHAISPLDGRYHRKLSALAPVVSEGALIENRIIVEAMWLLHLSEIPAVAKDMRASATDLNVIRELSQTLPPQAAREVKELESRTNHDVKAVEYWVQNHLRTKGVPDHVLAFVHFGCTSEDINNVAYGLMLYQVQTAVIAPLMEQILDEMRRWAGAYAALPMLSRTHGQTASPTTLGKEFAVFGHRLGREVETWIGLPILAKMNGAVGHWNAHLVAYPELDWLEVSRSFIARLGLSPNLYTTQIENHDGLAAFCDCLRRFNIILLDFARDVWGYIALGYFRQKTLEHEVGSSTMPHKVNPIDFENAEGNLGIAVALSQHFAEKLPVSRWQRDLSDSTVLRSMGTMFGHSVLALQSLLKGISKLQVNEEVIKKDLENSWEVLTEALQTILRRKGVVDAYDQMKKLSRGQTFGKMEWEKAVRESKQLSPEEQKELLTLTPAQYTGAAEKLARSFARGTEPLK